MTTDEVKKLIEAGIEEASAEVEDLTGTGDHFRAVVKSPAFNGKSRIQQHKMVEASVKEFRNDRQIHALSIKTIAV